MSAVIRGALVLLGALSSAPHAALAAPPTDPDLELPAQDTRPPAPPPPEPRANEQTPAPYLPEPPRERTELAEVGADFGLWLQPAEGNGVDYGPGLGWGAHARIQMQSWLAVRPFFQLIERSVTLRPGALGPAGVSFEQPNLRTLLLGGKLEPTWRLSRHFSSWIGLGAAWGRSVADEPSVTSGSPLRSAARSGVLLEYSVSVGARWEIIPRRLGFSLSIAGGTLTNQSGKLFQPMQAFDVGGHRVHLRGLPAFASSLSTLAGIGWIL